MKSFALLTTVSLIGLSTLATVRPVMALESRQPAETLIAQTNYKEAIAHFNRGINYIQQEKFDILAAVKRTAIPKPHDLGFCFFPLRGFAPALTDLLCSGLMVALQTD
ncbi:MAG: hypothetical protein O9290_26595, partial [Microcystis sp. LE19-41.2A]|nr:hypothetical protein [Microcystis sp. LE19-41.2A]MCZ8289973.1 hypothetical protein [Microcystis sp. LE19-59.1C]